MLIRRFIQSREKGLHAQEQLLKISVQKRVDCIDTIIWKLGIGVSKVIDGHMETSTKSVRDRDDYSQRDEFLARMCVSIEI